MSSHQPSPTQLLDLPTEVLGLVRQALPVRDRARFSAVLPRSARAALRGDKATQTKERMLGVLSGAVRKRRLGHTPPKVRDFLCTVPKSDPTWEELEEGLPGARGLPFLPQHRSLDDKLYAGHATLDDLVELHDMEPWMAACYMARLSPAMFHAALGDTRQRGGRELLQLAAEKHHDSFGFGLVNYKNFALLRHLMIVVAADEDAPIVQQLRDRVKEKLTTPLPLIRTHHLAREHVFACLHMPPETVRALYADALACLDVEAAMFYDKHLL